MRTYTRKQFITLKSSLLGLLVVAVLTLVGFNIKDLLFGSPFSVSTATNGATLTDTFLPITGDAVHAREITINGRPIALDRKGRFNDGIILSTGYNIIEVAVLDRFGKTKQHTLEVVLEPTSTIARTNDATYQQ